MIHKKPYPFFKYSNVLFIPSFNCVLGSSRRIFFINDTSGVLYFISPFLLAGFNMIFADGLIFLISLARSLILIDFPEPMFIGRPFILSLRNALRVSLTL